MRNSYGTLDIVIAKMINAYLGLQISLFLNIKSPCLLTGSFGMEKIGIRERNGCNETVNIGLKKLKKTWLVTFVLIRSFVLKDGHRYDFGQKMH